jgi:glycosyltransferase involved in cell wall biosynthesis
LEVGYWSFAGAWLLVLGVSAVTMCTIEAPLLLDGSSFLFTFCGNHDVNPIFISVTDTSRNPARSGVQTVVRGLIAGMAELGRTLRLVTWSVKRDAFTLLRLDRSRHIGAHHQPDEKFLPAWWLFSSERRRLFLRAAGRNYRVPLHEHPDQRQGLPNGWLLLPEVIYGDEIWRAIAYARELGLRVAAIFHDAIPVSHPHLVDSKAAQKHAEYLRAISQADMVFATSPDAAQWYRKLASKKEREETAPTVIAMPAEIIDIPRELDSTDARTSGVHILCVSTLEPRKNHQLLVQAFKDVCALRPELDLHLDLVGDAYAGSPQIASAILDEAKENPRIRWHGKVEPKQLRELYRQSRFTVYPSFLEGFGLPVLESLWLGKPCICANFGVMAENAAGGGCLTVDVCNRQALVNGILALATQLELRRSLAEQATHRRLKTWKDYAMEISNTLDSFSSPQIRSHP